MWYGADAPPPSGHEALSVAPMLDCTDRHFRFFARLLTRRTVLYTEMVWDRAVVARGSEDLDELIGRHECESPVVAQLGGESPELMARAAAACVHDYGYDAVNLNAGCPAHSDSCFGARLMREPERTARICASISRATGRAASLKCRIGVDEADSWAELLRFCERATTVGGVDHLVVHARKAILGLDPARNRTVPPLRHDVVHALADALPGVRITINGGIKSLAEAKQHLECSGVRGVMIGRQAYAEPWLLADADRALFGASNAARSRADVLAEYAEYAEGFAAARVAAGDPAHAVVRALLKPVHGLCHGTRDSRAWRQHAAEANHATARRWPVGARCDPDQAGAHVSELLAEACALLSEEVREQRPPDDDREPAGSGRAGAECPDRRAPHAVMCSGAQARVVAAAAAS